MTDEQERPRYNQHCPAHDCGYDWGHGHWMRQEDLVCTSCYKRLPSEIRKLIFDEDPKTQKGNYSIVVDWLLEHPKIK